MNNLSTAVSNDTSTASVQVLTRTDLYLKPKPYPWYVEVEILSVGSPLGCTFLAGVYGTEPECQEAYRTWLRSISDTSFPFAFYHMSKHMDWLGRGLQLWIIAHVNFEWVGELLRDEIIKRVNASRSNNR